MENAPVMSMIQRTENPLVQKGSVLVFSLIVLSFMLVSALSIAAVSVTERRSASTTEKSARSFQVADSGVEKMLQKIYKGGTYADMNALATALGSGASCGASGTITGTTASGSFKASLYDESDVQIACNDTDWRDKAIKLRSEGIAGNTTRAVEVAVKAPAPVVPIGGNACHVVGPIGSGSWSCSASEYVRRVMATTSQPTYATRMSVECCTF